MSDIKKKGLFQELTENQKSWLGRMLVNMVIIDKSIDPNEIDFLEKALMLLNPAEVMRVVKEKLPKKDFALENVCEDHEFKSHDAIKCLFFLGWSAIADAHLKGKEVKLMKLAGLCMRIHEDVINEVIDIFSHLNKLLADQVSTGNKNQAKGWMDCLSEEQKAFLGKAIFVMILSDGEIKQGELEYIGQAITLLGGAESKSHIMAQIKTYKNILAGEAPSLTIAAEYAVRIMYLLGYIGISDDNLDQREQKIMILIGKKMGLSTQIIKDIFELFAKLQRLLKTYNFSGGFPKITIENLFNELNQ